MATRIDVEITSDRGDGTLTWRAAGAKNPKGIVNATLLPAGAKVGDVLKADAEYTVDGPEIITLMPKKGPRGATIERLEVLGTGGPTEGVTTQLAKKQGRGRGRGGDRGRGPRGDRGGDRGFGGGRGGEGGRGDRGDRGRGGGGGRGDRGRGGSRGPAEIPTARTHREAWIASLPEARRPVAEQLMHEGQDGVKEALHRQNRAAASDGREPIDLGPILKIAESLVPGLQKAEWLDRVDGATAAADTADLRQLRKVFNKSADHVPADAHTALRSKIVARVDRDQATWMRELREALAEGRTVRALQKSGRPAKAGVTVPDDLLEQLLSAANEALDPEEEPHRWTVVIEALAGSPIRRLVRPESIPDGKDDDLLDTVDRVAHLVPGIAESFGLEARPPQRRRGRKSNS